MKRQKKTGKCKGRCQEKCKGRCQESVEVSRKRKYEKAKKRQESVRGVARKVYN